jgi:hypothetical protein
MALEPNVSSRFTSQFFLDISRTVFFTTSKRQRKSQDGLTGKRRGTRRTIDVKWQADVI